jgi:MtN3 and saliva related transmembrane protein
MATALGALAAAWGVIMAIAPTLQIRRMLTRRSSADVSLGYFSILLPGFGLWVAYGSVRSDWALVVPNTVAFAVGTTVLVVALSLPRRAGARDAWRTGHAWLAAQDEDLAGGVDDGADHELGDAVRSASSVSRPRPTPGAVAG